MIEVTDATWWFVFGLMFGWILCLLFLLALARHRRRSSIWTMPPYRGGPLDGALSLPCNPELRELRIEAKDGVRLYVYRRSSAESPWEYAGVESSGRVAR